jgi:hypothetical protein
MSATRTEQLYETDFYAWTQAQAKELRRFARTRPNLPLDLAHIAEEIRDLGKSEYEALFSLVQQILQHFLLIEHSPAKDQRLHWADQIDGFRDQLDRKLSPAIKRQLKREFEEAFARASARATQDDALRRDGCRRQPACKLPLHARAGPRRLAAARGSARARLTGMA